MAQGPEGRLDSDETRRYARTHARTRLAGSLRRLLRRPGSLADIGGASPDLVGQLVQVGRVLKTRI